MAHQPGFLLPKKLSGCPNSILAQFPKQHQQSPKQQLHQVRQQTQQQVAQPSQYLISNSLSGLLCHLVSSLPFKSNRSQVNGKMFTGDGNSSPVWFSEVCNNIYGFTSTNRLLKHKEVLIPNYILRPCILWGYLYREN